jgi:hypothetical protein
MIKGLVVEFFEPVKWRISIGEGLKISDEFISFVTLFHEFTSFQNLIIYGEAIIDHVTSTGTPPVTKDTPPIRNGSITVGAIEPCIQ